MLQRDPGAALLLETWLTKTGHIHGASSLDIKSVRYDRTHQSWTGEVDLAALQLQTKHVYKKTLKLQQNAN